MGKEQDLLDYIESFDKERYDKLKNNPDLVIDAIEEFLEVKKTGFMTIGLPKGELIRKEMQKASPVIMIELGCYIGYSAILFGNELRKINGASSKATVNPKYYSFEANEEYAKIARKLIDLAGLSDLVEIILGQAGTTLPDFEQRTNKENGKYTPVDFVFIDHQKDLYVPDLRILESLNLIYPGTVICADNIYQPGAPEYVKYVQATPQERQEHNSNNPNPSNPMYPGRWNVIYDLKTVPVTNPKTGFKDAVEITRCVEYLSG
uniref:catechol O-methyltransferase n=1 Tax=Candidozyma auris TaxID=498019 RepID=A0A0L0NY97_CANAR